MARIASSCSCSQNLAHDLFSLGTLVKEERLPQRAALRRPFAGITTGSIRVLQASADVLVAKVGCDLSQLLVVSGLEERGRAIKNPN